MGSPEANIPQDIQLVGAHIASDHCVFENIDGKSEGSKLGFFWDFFFSGIVKMIPCSDALCYVNGRKVAEPVVLKSGSRVILGKNHVFRFHHPEQVTKILEEKKENENVKDVDWEYAQSELLEREGVDLKLEMETKMKEMEDLWKKEKEEATQAFQQERKKYEDQIETLQKQVMEQSMTMSMMSSVTPDDFNHDDDLYGKSLLVKPEKTLE